MFEIIKELRNSGNKKIIVMNGKISELNLNSLEIIKEGKIYIMH